MNQSELEKLCGKQKKNADFLQKVEITAKIKTILNMTFRKNMKILRYITSFLIIIIIFLGSGSIFIISQLFGQDTFLLSSWFFSILIIEFFLFTAVFYYFYDRPIRHLEYTIKRFLVGSLKEEDIHFDRTSNPHLNYILAFFKRTLTTLKNIKSEFIHGKEIKGEVELASEIQEKLLHKKIPQVPHLEIVAKSKPAGEIGGDSFDIIEQGDNYYIYVGDATGHGVGAGFIMMMVNALMSGFAKVTQKGNHILALTNDIIKPRVKANLLMSMLLVRWNAAEERLYMTGAGHEYLMIYKHAQKKCFKIKSGGVALGMTRDIHKVLKEREVSFEPNDVLILYSDGITEAINQNKKDGNERMFGEDLLVKTIESSPAMDSVTGILTARSIFKNISIQLSKFMGYKYVQLDDITLVTIQYISPEYKKEFDCDENMTDDFVTEWRWEK